MPKWINLVLGTGRGETLTRVAADLSLSQSREKNNLWHPGNEVDNGFVYAI